jgi:hypothetical protein
MNQRGNRTPTRIDNRTIYQGDKGGRIEPRSNIGKIDNRGNLPGPAVTGSPVKHNSFKCPECGAVAAVKRTITEEDSGVIIRECECTNKDCKAWNKDKNRGFRFKA